MQGTMFAAQSKAALTTDSAEFRSAFERRRHQTASWLADQAGYQLAAGGYSQANGERELSASVSSQQENPLRQLALPRAGDPITPGCSSTQIPCCRICCLQAETLCSTGVKFSLLARKSSRVVSAALLGLSFGTERPGGLFSQSPGTPPVAKTVPSLSSFPAASNGNCKEKQAHMPSLDHSQYPVSQPNPSSQGCPCPWHEPIHPSITQT